MWPLKKYGPGSQGIHLGNNNNKDENRQDEEPTKRQKYKHTHRQTDRQT